MYFTSCIVNSSSKRVSNKHVPSPSKRIEAKQTTKRTLHRQHHNSTADHMVGGAVQEFNKQPSKNKQTSSYMILLFNNLSPNQH